MRLTRTQVALLGVGIVVVIVFVVQLIRILHPPPGAPSDTPVVIGGGSIYGKTWKTDTVGWTSVSSVSYFGQLHPGPVHNPHGIDELTFANFDSTPNPNPVTNTGGWAIMVRNPLPPPATGPNPTPAVSFCSDASCSAALPGCNPGSFNKKGALYFKVRAGALINPVPGSGPGTSIGEIDFHDTTSGCTPGTCEKVYDVTLYTCNGGANPVFTSKCPMTNPQTCTVTVGHS